MAEDVTGDAAQRLVLLPHQDRVVEEPVELDRRLGHELVDVEAVRELIGASKVAGALLLGEAAKEEVFGDRPGAHEERAEPAADRALDLEGLVDVGLLDVVALDEELVEALREGRAPVRSAAARHRFRPLVHLPAASRPPSNPTAYRTRIRDTGRTVRPQEHFTLDGVKPLPPGRGVRGEGRTTIGPPAG